MIKQTSNNWLEPFRQQQKHKQESLANALHINVRTISRWENYETVNNIPYYKIATVLETEEQILKDAHKQGLIQHKNQQANKKPINKSLIIKALEDCQAMGLTGQILKTLDVKTIEQAAEKVVDWLQQGNMLPFSKHFNQLIKTAIETIGKNTVTDLDLIEQLMGHIALSATIPHDSEQLDKNQTFYIFGVKHSWSIRLLIDASLGYPISGITAISETSLKGMGGVKIEESTKDKVWQAAHEIIKNLVDELFMEKEPFPELVESEGHQELPEEDQYPEFKKYCKERVNRAIEQKNHEYKHCFLFSLQQEPEDVQQRVLMLLENIRVFISRTNYSGTSILRIKEEKLEAWMANTLYAIQMRRTQIKPSKLIEDTKMKPESTSVTISNSGDGAVSVAVNDSTSNQLNHVSEREQLKELLNKILSETDRTIPEHQQLRGDVNEILNPLNRNEIPPEQGKNWLQDGLDKIKCTSSDLI